MALSEKTVTYHVPLTAAVANDTVTNLDQILIHLPDNPISFSSVFMEMTFQDLAVVAANITSHSCGISLGGAEYTTFVENLVLANSGENIGGVIGPFDFTSHFSTNWSGTSLALDTQVKFTQAATGVANVSAVIHITYVYDDTASVQIKTVAIPMESNTTALLTTAFANFGTDQIPQLTGAGGFLPEAGIVIRDYTIVLEGNDNTASATDYTLSMAIDGSASLATVATEAALATDRFIRIVYKPAIPDTETLHQLNLWCSTTIRAYHITATLYVTYEFTLEGTSRVLNSICLPVELSSPLGKTTAPNASRFTRDIVISEPGAVDFRQSAIRINWNCATTGAAFVARAGSQGYRTYLTAAGVSAGMYSMQHRLDPGATGGAGLSLARGRNTLIFDAYSTNPTTELTNINGYVILNYHSDRAASLGAHAHTIRRALRPWSSLAADYVPITDFALAIPEPNHWFMGIGFCFTQWAATASMAVTFDVQCKPEEGKGGGYYDIYSDAYVSDTELSCSLVWMRGRDVFKRFPLEADADRLDIQSPRLYRIYTTVATRNGMISVATYHAHTWTVSGSLQGADAEKSTTLDLVKSANGEVLQKQILPAGITSFNFTVYDNTEDYYISAYQDDAHLGRSAAGKAT